MNAPFGRFTPESDFLTLDGIKSWMIMELVSPITFITTFMKAPLATSTSTGLTGSHPATFLAGLFITHYTNRALISPLRTPSRSRAHISVTVAGMVYNLCNGFLVGAYLSSSEGISATSTALSRWTFWLGIALWSFGFVGNAVHDEVLLNIRRNQKRKGKQQEGKESKKEHYAIPYGYLYRFISYPNYLCEWIEWVGFALAASPGNFTTPPWLFVFAEVMVMTPRAWRGHQWYHHKFPEYPKERKAIIPFIL